MSTVQVTSVIKTPALRMLPHHFTYNIPTTMNLHHTDHEAAGTTVELQEHCPHRVILGELIWQYSPILVQTSRKMCRGDVRNQFIQIFNFEFRITAIKCSHWCYDYWWWRADQHFYKGFSAVIQFATDLQGFLQWLLAENPFVSQRPDKGHAVY